MENTGCAYFNYESSKLESHLPRGFFRKDWTSLTLHEAATYRKQESMCSLLSTGADPNIRDKNGKTPLHLVIPGWMTIKTNPDSESRRHKHAEACLRLLCEHGANVNAWVEDQSQQTVLHIVVQNRALRELQILTGYGADVNSADIYGKTPLHIAAGMLDKNLISSLIHRGANINAVANHSGNTPLHIAVVAVVIKNSKTNENGFSCLTELLEQGAEPNITNKVGMTPLHEACSMRSNELVDLLLSYGGDINKLSKSGENCLFLFLNHRPEIKCIALLMKLLSLTSPLTIFDQNGRLPSTLTEPCLFKHRDLLIRLTQQPRRLQDICKRDIYLKHVGSRSEELRKQLPVTLYDFVFNHWETQSITFEVDCEQDFSK